MDDTTKPATSAYRSKHGADLVAQLDAVDQRPALFEAVQQRAAERVARCVTRADSPNAPPSARSISAHHMGVGIGAKARSISGSRGSGTTRRMVAVVPPPCAARGYPLLRPTSRVAMSAAPKVAALSIRLSAVPPGIG